MERQTETSSALPGRRAVLFGLAAILAAGIADTAEAQKRRRRRRRRRRRAARQREIPRERQEMIRRAVANGQIKPLRRVMKHFRDRTGNEILDVEHRLVGNRHVYGFKAETPDGRLIWYTIDAATLEIVTK